MDALLDMSILSLSRDFAANVGISFHTPEEYFRHEEPRVFVRAFEPAAYTAEESTSARTFEIQHSSVVQPPIFNISRSRDIHEADHSRDHYVLW
jgi:hypothetical protein